MTVRSASAFLTLCFVLALTACRTTASKTSYATSSNDLETIKSKTCVNFEKKDDCWLRLRNYQADENTIQRAEKEMDEEMQKHFASYPEEKASYEEELQSVRNAAHRSKDQIKIGEARAIRFYAGSWFSEMNKGLRGDERLWLLRKNVIYTAASGLNRMQSRRYQGSVYRTESASKDKLRSLLETYKPGNIVLEPTFLSTTTSSTLNFSPPNRISVSLSYKIQSKTGVDIVEFSLNDREQEVLFVPGTVFQVKTMESKMVDIPETQPPAQTERLEIELEEVELD